MAETTISNVQVNIRTNANSASSQVKKLKLNIQSLKTAAAGVKSAFSGLVAPLTNFLAMFKRIAIYRTIRSIVRLFTEGVGTGLKNFIKYSESAQAAMDKFATASAYLKNSIGAALMPVLENLIPVFEKIVNWLVKGIEAFSQWYAYINGKTTYSRAKSGVFVKYGDDAEDATKKANELKRTILGFDEINALSKQTSSDDNTSTEDLFEEAAIDAETVKRFQHILEIAEKIAIAIAAWKLVNFLFDLATAITKLGTISSIIAGLALITIGVVLTYTGFEDYFETGNKNSLYKGLAGVLATVLGSAFIGFKLGGGVGLAIGIAVGVVISLATISFAWQQAEYNKTHREFLEQLDNLKSDIENGNSLVIEVQGNIDVRWGTIVEDLSNYSAARSLLDEIYELVDKENKGDGDIAILNNLIDEFNNLDVTDIKLQYDALTGSINKTKEEMQELLKTQLKASIMSSASSNASAALVDKYRLQYQLKSANSDVEKAKDLLQQATDDMNAHGGAGNLGSGGAPKAYKDAYADAYKAYQDAIDVKNDIEQQITQIDDEYKSYFDLMSGEFEVALDSEGNYTITSIQNLSSGLTGIVAEAVDSISVYSDGVSTIITDTMGNCYKDVEHTVIEIQTLITDLNPTITIRTKIEKDDSDKTLYSQVSPYANTTLGMKTLWRWKGFGGTSGGTFATGGFPEDGLFFANHNELVGQFSNGRTAVANNEQIIEGIKRGVADGMAQSGGTGGDWTIQIIDENGNVRGEQIVSALQRYNKQVGKTVVQVN